MKPKLIILTLITILLTPTVLGYNYVISNYFPPNNSYAPFPGQNCQPVTVSYSVALQVTPSDLILHPIVYWNGIDIYMGVITNKVQPPPTVTNEIWGPIQHITRNAGVDGNFMIPNVCYNEIWNWQPVISEDGGFTIKEAGEVYWLRGQIVNVSYPPPSASNLKNCLNGTGTNCYDSGASFAYSTSMVYPVFNLSSSASRVTVSLYASSSTRGTLPTSKRTTDMSGTSKIYIASGIPVQPGETITWYAELDDGVHTPVTKTNSVTFSINPAPNAPPIISITHPSNGQHFIYGQTITTINATVTDADTPQSSITVQFFLNNILQCTRNQASQYYSCDVSTVNAGTYKAVVTAVDSISENKRNQTIYFTIDSPSSSKNHLPDFNLLPYVNRVAKNGNLTFTLNASDRDGDPLYFDYYCQYVAENDTSRNAEGDDTYASSNLPWAGPYYVTQGEPYQYTFSCPDKKKNPAQWNTPGKYLVLACVTDGSSSDGKGGFGRENYHACAPAEIEVMNSESIITFSKDESIQFNTCLVSSDTCSPGILNEFYHGAVGFVKGFIFYFIYLFIIFVIVLSAYYLYIRVREGIL